MRDSTSPSPNLRSEPSRSLPQFLQIPPPNRGEPPPSVHDTASTQQRFWSHLRPRHVRPRRLQSTQQRLWSLPTQPSIVRFKCIWSPSHLFK
ncbi:hypothetical protein AHAS_Ahas10G0125500 [Arachis hypogaea]